MLRLPGNRSRRVGRPLLPAEVSLRRSAILPEIAGLVLISAAATAPTGRPGGHQPEPAGAVSQLAPPPDTITRKYDVHFAYTGWTGLIDAPDCVAMVNPQGYDSLVGTLIGLENPDDPDEPVMYVGTLRRTVRIDYCQTWGPDDQPKWCVATLTGAARMQVELEVYGEEGRGAWLKARPDSLRPRPDSVRVSGTCPRADMDSIAASFPRGDSGGSPSGQPIDEPEPPKFYVAGIARLRVGLYPADPQQGGWVLRVVRGPP